MAQLLMCGIAGVTQMISGSSDKRWWGVSLAAVTARDCAPDLPGGRALSAQLAGYYCTSRVFATSVRTAYDATISPCWFVIVVAHRTSP